MDLGIKKVGDRIRIYQSLKVLRAKETESPAKIFNEALKALDTQSVSPFNYNTSSTVTAPQLSSLRSSRHLTTAHPQLQPQHHYAIHSQSSSSQSNTHSSKNTSPLDPYFQPQSSTRYPVPPKTKLNATTAKFSLSAPVSASDAHPQTVTQTSPDDVKNLLSMDIVKQSIVRFIYSQGHSKAVYISGCFNGDSIKRKALKKGGVKDLPENWAIHIADNELGTTTRQVSDNELVAICHSQDRKERNRLMLCAIGSSPSIKQLSKSQQILRESISTPSPASSKASNDNDDDDYNDHTTLDDYNNSGTLTPSSVAQQANLFKDNSTVMSNETSKKRLRKFYGQRPPSGLISNNLKEYFPEAGPAVLKETIRNSIMYKRMSRISRISHRSSIASAWGYTDDTEEVPPLPSFDDMVPPGSQMSLSQAGDSNTSRLYSQNPVSSPNPSYASLNLPPADTSTVGKNLLPPTPQSAHTFSTTTTAAVNTYNNTGHSATINKRSSSLSLLSHRLSEPDLPSETAVETPHQKDLEEEFMDAFNKERSGPSRWIKGTVIGSGSFGTVYLGMNSITGELMAVKQVELPSGNKETEQRKLTMIDALQREMNLLRDLQHVNIVQYLGSNSEESYLNIFLEYVPGGSVATMLSNYGAFEESLIRNFVRQILHGLKYLHDRSIIHRDIKGANVLVDNKGGIKISDFGISKKLEARLLTAENNRVSLQGSVYWMAPEVVKQTSYTLKADIWSLGCLIIEMFTGTHPFPEFSQMQAIFKIGTFVAPSIPEGCSIDAQDFLKQTFEIDFNKRPTAEELLKQPFLKPLL